MNKPPKLTKRNIFKDVDYLDKLSEEEKQWLFNFEIKEKHGIGGTKEDVSKANQKAYAAASDWMNNSPETILNHLAKKNESRKKGRKRNVRVNNKEEADTSTETDNQ